MNAPMTADKRTSIGRIAGYFHGNRWLQGYVRGKLASDPAYDAVLQRLGGASGSILDIGCGLGLLSFYLREHGHTGEILGVDLESKKIAKAAAIAREHYTGLSFATTDARDVSGSFSHIVMLDVLHYLDDAAQVKLLEWMAGAVAPGGCVILRNAPRDNSIRYRITYLEELFVRASGWISGGIINFPTCAEVSAPFQAAGFVCEIGPLWGGTPFNSHLFVFTRPAAP